MGRILAVCISEQKGTPKHRIDFGELVAGHGLLGDAHAGNWHRQVSLLSHEKIAGFRARGAEVEDGSFGENLIVEGVDLSGLPVGTLLQCGTALLELTQIGKECHQHCQIFQRMGDCIMPREGVFVRVLRGGPVRAGDEISPIAAFPYRVGILVSSDACSEGEREDLSGKVIAEIATDNGYIVADYALLPDEQSLLEEALRRMCDSEAVDLLLTTGGTGFSVRDCMPEATVAVAEREVPGISEAIRQHSMAITKRAMLSRAISAIRGKTLIVNLPGSPKAVREALGYIIGELRHGLDILTGRDGNCATSSHRH